MDADTVFESVAKVGKVVTLENHLKVGGLSEQIAGVLAEAQSEAPLWPMALPRGSLGSPLTLLLTVVFL